MNKIRKIIWIYFFNYKGREIGEVKKKTDEPGMSQRDKAKLMDPEKFALVQKYLEDVQDTRSMTTEVSDSGLATHTAASELGTEEINGKSVNIYIILTFMNTSILRLRP